MGKFDHFKGQLPIELIEAMEAEVESSDTLENAGERLAIIEDSYVSKTSSTLHLYADSATGLDSNTGLSASSPKQTVAAVMALVPYIIEQRVIVHLAGDLAVTTDSSLLSNRTIGNIKGGYAVTISGEDDVTVVDDNSGSNYSATGSSTASVTVSGAGWTPNEFHGRMVEILDGPEAGMLRGVQRNTTDTIYFVRTLGSDPTNPSFRVVRPKTRIYVTSPNGYGSNVQLLNNSGPGMDDIMIQRLHFEDARLFPSGSASIGLNSVTSRQVVATTQEEFLAHGYVGLGPLQFYNTGVDPDTGLTLAASNRWAKACSIVADTGMNVKTAGQLVLIGVGLGGVLTATDTTLNFQYFGAASAVYIDCIIYETAYPSSIVLEGGGADPALKIIGSNFNLTGTLTIHSGTGNAVYVESSDVLSLPPLDGAGVSGFALHVGENSKVVIADSGNSITASAGDITFDGIREAATLASVEGGTPAISELTFSLVRNASPVEVVATRDHDVLHLYLSETGDDNDDGMSAATPKATIEAIRAMLPDTIVNHVIVHVDGMITLTERVYFSDFEISRRRTDIGPAINFMFAGSGTYAIYDDNTGSNYTATGSSTSTVTVSGAGWTPDEFRGRCIEPVAGAEAGSYFTVISNTTDTCTVMGSTDIGLVAFRFVHPADGFYAATRQELYFTAIFGSPNSSVTLQNIRFTDESYPTFSGIDPQVSLRGVLIEGAASGLYDTALYTNQCVSVFFGIWDIDTTTGETIYAPFADTVAAVATVSGRTQISRCGACNSYLALLSEVLIDASPLSMLYGSQYDSLLMRNTQKPVTATTTVADGNRMLNASTPLSPKIVGAVVLRNSELRMQQDSGKAAIVLGSLDMEDSLFEVVGTATIPTEIGGINAVRSAIDSAIDVQVSGVTGDAISLDHSTLHIAGDLTGSGNTGFSLNVGDNSHAVLEGTNTITSTAGDITFDGTNEATTFSAVEGGTPAISPKTNSLVRDSATIEVLATDVINGGSIASYGEIYVRDNSTATSFGGTGESSKSQVAIFDTNGVGLDATPDYTNYHITIGEAGVYRVSFSVVLTGTASQEIGFAVYKNNGATAFDNLHEHLKLSTNGDVNGGSHGLITLAAGDTLELWCWNETLANDITISDAVLSIDRVG